MVPRVGIEPTLCKPESDFESDASTNSATAACHLVYNDTVKGEHL